jgi:hypothetical protein
MTVCLAPLLTSRKLRLASLALVAQQLKTQRARVGYSVRIPVLSKVPHNAEAKRRTARHSSANEQENQGRSQ